MLVKMAVTTTCGARCKTCPSWKRKKTTMSVEDFRKVLGILDGSSLITWLSLNGTGDLYSLPNAEEYLKDLRTLFKKRISLTTNGASLPVIPEVDSFIISFNGGDKRSYESTTKLDFDQVVLEIRRNYDQLKKVNAEIHCLIWEGNQGCEQAFMDLWKDFPGHLRFSYKVDNQLGTLGSERARARVPCDYLRGFTIDPDGSVIRCCHDYHQKSIYGNILRDSLEDIFASEERMMTIKAHNEGVYPGICAECNYNSAEPARILYVK